MKSNAHIACIRQLFRRSLKLFANQPISMPLHESKYTPCISILGKEKLCKLISLRYLIVMVKENRWSRHEVFDLISIELLTLKGLVGPSFSSSKLVVWFMLPDIYT